MSSALQATYSDDSRALSLDVTRHEFLIIYARLHSLKPPTL